jgi:hypothetical protein
MATVTVEIPFTTASPAEIRGVLLPEELPQFEEQYAAALREAAETYRLDRLNSVMMSWRRIAWMTHSDPEAHRRMLARVEHTLTTGQRPPEGASADEIRGILRERLGR